MIRKGYCRYCSVHKEDKRELKIEEDTIECTNCGMKLKQVPTYYGSPYYYLEEVEENE